MIYPKQSFLIEQYARNHIVDAGNLKEFFQALPELMEDFRREIAEDCKEYRELKQRLAEGYINGYLAVQ